MKKTRKTRFSDREIEWYPLRVMLAPSVSTLIDVNFPQVPNLSFKVGGNNASQMENVSSYFNKAEPIIKSDKEAPTLFYNDSPDTDFIKNQWIKKEDAGSRFVGFVNYDLKKEVVFGSPEFGLFKSVIIGFASSLIEQRGYHPAHASLCSINGNSIMMTGGHKSGKTTSLFHLLNATDKNTDKKVLTDDWLVINESSGLAVPLEDKLSFSRAFCLEFPHLNLTRFYDSQASPGVKKIYITPEVLYGQGSKIDSAGLDFIVFLDPVGRKNLIEHVKADYVVDGIVNGTYHMPDCDKRRVEKHKSFWSHFLKNKEFISFDTRNSLGPVTSYQELYKFFKSIF